MAEKEKKSVVWSFFEECKDNKTAKCNHCPTVYHITGSTGGMLYHLTKKHPKLYADAVKKREEEENSLFENFDPQKKQTILQILNNSGKQEIDATKKEILDELTFNMLIEKPLSFRFLESSTFIEMMKFTSPLYKIPSRKYLFGDFMEKRVQQFYTKLKEQVKDKVLSISVDEWSQLHSTNCLLSITLHFINNEGKRSNLIGGCVFLSDSSHTAATYEKTITEKMKELDVPLDKIVSCVRDGASVMNALTNRLNVSHSVHCGNHLTQLCITDVIYDSNFTLKLLLDKVRTTINTIRRSNYLTSLVKRLQKEQKKPIRKFILDVRTRWSSLFLMIKCFNEQVDIVNAVCIKAMTYVKLSSVEKEEKEQLDQLILLLEPFFNANAHFSKRNSTIAHSCAVFKWLETSLMELLDGEKLTEEMGSVAYGLLESIGKRKPKSGSFESQASLIDPRIAYLEVFTEDEWKEIENNVYVMLQKFDYEHDPEEEENIIVEEPPAKKLNLNPIFSTLDKGAKPKEAREDKKVTIKKELAVYKSFCLSKEKHPELSKDVEYVFQFWAKSGDRFKFLKKFANIVLSTPSSSIESERLFSLAGLISANKLRNRMSGKKLEQLCFLVANKKHGLLINEKVQSSEEVLDLYGNYFQNRLLTEDGDEDIEEESDGYISDEY